jgi:nucleoside-diphosphate-sugar epimerase
MKRAIVCGAGGFIGSHLVTRLKADGYWVRGADLKFPEFSSTDADDFIQGDLRSTDVCHRVFDQPVDEVYQLAADMGGAGFVFTGENDAEIMHNSATINLNVLEVCRQRNIKRIFYSSSACMYPEHNQLDPENPLCSEESAYPANPDSEYGWEKLFSERLYLAYGRNHGLDVRIGRYHNIFGPMGTWDGGREKAPAAVCRKVAAADRGTEIEIWGDGKQTRSFLYVDECVEGTLRLMRSEWEGPVNIGSEEMVSINELARMVMSVADKQLAIKHVKGPEGVRGRNSDNRLIQEKLGWEPTSPLIEGLQVTYKWIKEQLKERSGS